MKKYIVPFRIEFSGHIEIEAESKQEANKYAKENIRGSIHSKMISGLENNSVVEFEVLYKSTNTKTGFITMSKNQE